MYLFSIFGVLTVFGTGNATQVNTITTAIDSALFNYGIISKDSAYSKSNYRNSTCSIIIVNFIRWNKEIGQVTEKLVPFMAVIYIVFAGVVALNFQNIPCVCFYF